MYPRRRQRFVAWFGFVALAIQSVLVFGHHHHHDHPQKTEFERGLIAAWDVAAVAQKAVHDHTHPHHGHAQAPAQHQDQPGHDNDGTCEICWTIRADDNCVLPVGSAPTLRTPERIDPGSLPVTAGCDVQFAEANLPRAPPNNQNS